MVCEKGSATTTSSIVSWVDASGSMFCLRAIAEGEEQLSLGLADAKLSEQNRIHTAGTSAAVWKIGDVYCKVKSYVPGMPLEADTIGFVKSKDSTVTFPEVIHTWVDESMCRTFVLLKQIKGRTLEQCWSSLSSDQHSSIAVIIARLCKSHAKNTSCLLQSASGYGVVEPFLNATPPVSRPPWMPYLLGPSPQADSLPISSIPIPLVRIFQMSLRHFISTMLTSDEHHYIGRWFCTWCFGLGICRILPQILDCYQTACFCWILLASGL
ncbi:hypothetical protein GX50_08940 [[Emmonsia] crescens]|uniref:Uncharacterized protein n=1 Tax=[Emmonsia] crescens TaxID=73230 RepID=A0A2B7Z344_9EURO|nr:hypothetical protein GX50_08940 [Emmonsia crescens]